jgi:hypothetical protein
MFFDKIIKLNRNLIAITENISIVFQLFLLLTVKLQIIKKVDFSEFRYYFFSNTGFVHKKYSVGVNC